MEQDALAQAEQLDHRVIPLVLQWVSQVAAHRQHLRDCILRFEVAGEARIWKFLLAILWPSPVVEFVELRQEEDEEVRIEDEPEPPSTTPSSASAGRKPPEPDGPPPALKRQRHH